MLFAFFADASHGHQTENTDSGNNTPLAIFSFCLICGSSLANFHEYGGEMGAG